MVEAAADEQDERKSLASATESASKSTVVDTGTLCSDLLGTFRSGSGEQPVVGNVSNLRRVGILLEPTAKVDRVDIGSTVDEVNKC